MAGLTFGSSINLERGLDSLDLWPSKLRCTGGGKSRDKAAEPLRRSAPILQSRSRSPSPLKGFGPVLRQAVSLKGRSSQDEVDAGLTENKVALRVGYGVALFKTPPDVLFLVSLIAQRGQLFVERFAIIVS